MSNKSQVTIFIVLGLIIFVGIIAVFFFIGRGDIQEKEEADPQKYIEKCLRDAVSPSVDLVMENGGRISPELFIMYQSEKYNYLCYQKNYYLTCINHYPQLKNIIEAEIKQDSEEKVKKCFSTLKTNLEKKGWTVSEGVMDWKVEILPGKVLISVNKKLDISQESNTQNFKIFESTLLSPVFDLAMVAREIVNQESQYCNFEYNGFMLLYPNYDIKRIDYDDSKIYMIKDRLTSKTFKFAIRSCAFAPGL